MELQTLFRRDSAADPLSLIIQINYTIVFQIGLVSHPLFRNQDPIVAGWWKTGSNNLSRFKNGGVIRQETNISLSSFQDFAGWRGVGGAGGEGFCNSISKQTRNRKRLQY
jgi:hypothetical protein